MAEIMLKSIQLPGSADVYKIPEPVEIDESLSITGAAADAAAVGTALANIVPTSRMINGKELSSDISLSAEDVGAIAQGGALIYGGVYNGNYDEAELGIWWSQPKDSGCSNYPEGATYGFLTTSKGNNSKCQTYAEYSNGITWLRTYTNYTGWSNWFRQDGYPKLFSVIKPEKITVTETVTNEDGTTTTKNKTETIWPNLDDYRGAKKTGLYLCDRDRKYTPFSEKMIDNIFILEVHCNFQRATDPQTDQSQFRYYDDTTGWSAWEEFNIRKKLSNIIVNGANQAPHKAYEVLLTYLANKDRLYYGTPGFVGYEYDKDTGKFKPQTITGKYGGVDENGNPINPKFPIVCSTIAMLALQGVGFENCRINTGKITSTTTIIKENDIEKEVVVPQLAGGENISYAGCKTIDLTEKEIIDYWDISKISGAVTHPTGTIYAANMAKLFYDAGLLHKIKTSNYTEILPGDVLFYANYTGGNTYTPFLSIGHVEIFLGWDGNQILSLGTDNETDTPTIAYSKKPTDWSFTKYLKYYARIPCAGSPGAVKQIADSLPSSPYTVSSTKEANGDISTVSLKIEMNEPLKRNRAYPLVIKTTGQPEGGEPKDKNFYFNIMYNFNGKQLLSQIWVEENKGQNVGPNTYYTTLLIPESVKINGVETPLTEDITTLFIYGYGVDKIVTGSGESQTVTYEKCTGSAIIESVSVYNTIVPQG